jgi:glutamyl-tRNA synthetase
MSSTNPSVRVRFAPSPTGFLHVGGVRSALYNWLWARHTGGTFALRLEDTDRARLANDAANQINDSLEALGLAPDEGPRQGGDYGPYVQSKRLSLYRKHADQLIESGALYRCWCSPERLAGLREAAQRQGVAFKYDRHCLAPENQRSDSEPHVLRFRIPDEPTTVAWDDAVRGAMSFETATLDDFVTLKADGYPSYHFAHVVDDHLMKMSHILRADEWIPSTPKHLLLFAAFGWEPPVYAHLPAILGPSGTKKLSKRDGAQSVQEYLDEGYLPEALRSFLASLGWNDGTTQEIYTTPELVARFTLDRIQKSPAKFDKERLTWINGAMIREMSLKQLLERSEAFWPTSAASSTPAYKLQVLGLVQERLKFLAEIPELTGFFFTDPNYGEAPEADTELVERSRAALQESDFTESDLETRLRGLATELDVKPGTLFTAIRIAVTGKKAAPGLFETLHVLGKEVTLRRLLAFANR